jgi:hypothetical protein
MDWEELESKLVYKDLDIPHYDARDIPFYTINDKI